MPGLLNRSMNWLTAPSGITETCVGMRTLKFDPLFRTAMRGFHCGQKLTLHKQAGYICADRLFQSQESACKRAADHTYIFHCRCCHIYFLNLTTKRRRPEARSSAPPFRLILRLENAYSAEVRLRIQSLGIQEIVHLANCISQWNQ